MKTNGTPSINATSSSKKITQSNSNAQIGVQSSHYSNEIIQNNASSAGTSGN